MRARRRAGAPGGRLRRVRRRAACRRARGARPATAASSAPTSRSRAACRRSRSISGHLGRRRRLLAGADRLRRDDRGARACSSPGPAWSREAMGEDVVDGRSSAARACTRATASAHLVADDDRAAAELGRDLLSLPAAALGASRPIARRPARRRRATPAAVVPAERAQGLRRARRRPRRSSTAASCSRSRRAGRATWSPALARIDGRPVGRDRQPAAAPRRRDRRRRLREGGALRPHAATRSGCRWWCSSTRPASCRARAQEGAGRDPPRRRAAARLRRGARCRRLTVVLRKAYGGALHHDELEGPRRRPRLRLARRRDRGHGGARRRSGSSTAARSRAADAGRRARPARRRVRGRAPDAPRPPRARASSTR